MNKRQDPKIGGRRWRLAASAGLAALALGSLPSVADTQPVPPIADISGSADEPTPLSGDMLSVSQDALFVISSDGIAGTRGGLSFSFAVLDGGTEGDANGAGALPEDDQAAFLEPPIDKSSERVLRIGTADELIAMFEAIGFSYVDVRDSGHAVPRLQVAAFPGDIGDLNTLFLRKSAFFNTLLPIVLQVNEDILTDRRRLSAVQARLDRGEGLTPAEDRWLSDIAERYRVADRDVGDLLIRVDIVPPSMAMAMAAVESGWGTSTMARRGNALFGQITTRGVGIEGASGNTYATFPTLHDSVAAYARNLNTHGAYRDFRALRHDMRQDGEALDGYRLMGTLLHYSELRDRYIAYIRRVMRNDDLILFDDARLVPVGGLGSPS